MPTRGPGYRPKHDTRSTSGLVGSTQALFSPTSHYSHSPRTRTWHTHMHRGLCCWHRRRAPLSLPLLLPARRCSRCCSWPPPSRSAVATTSSSAPGRMTSSSAVTGRRRPISSIAGHAIRSCRAQAMPVLCMPCRVDPLGRSTNPSTALMLRPCQLGLAIVWVIPARPKYSLGRASSAHL